MKSCMNEGKLRACLDRELPEDEAKSVSRHLLACKQCSAKFELLRSRAASIAAMMCSLQPLSADPPNEAEEALVHIWSRARRTFAARLLWAASAGVGLVLLLVAVAVTEKHSSVPVIQKRAGPALSIEKELPQAPKTKSAGEGSAGSAARKVDGFLPLDDGEPIQMGFIVRMNLPAWVLSPWEGGMRSGEIQADVIVDETGRARAVRFLK
jgi:hypothetical protein